MHSRGKFLSLVPLGGGKRFSRVCPSAICEDDARKRAELGTELVRAMYAGGREVLVVSALEQLVDSAPDKVGDVLEGWRRVVGGALGDPKAPSRPLPPIGETFATFGERWTTGELHKLYPDHIGALDDATAKDYAFTLRKYVNPTIGPLPLKAITLDHALDVMRKIPDTLSSARRRHVAQAMHRVLKIAAFPARVIALSPIPRGFLPKPGPGRAKVLPEIAEEAAVLALPEDRAPLVERLLLGFLAREGCRKEDAAGLQWGDTRAADAPGWIDLAAGKVYLDQHKTLDTQGARDPWRLQPDVLAALRRWRELRPRARRIFPGEGGAQLNVEHLADRQRAYYEAAGVARRELHESTKGRRRLVVHDLRSLFCTLAFARGESEGWITARTGHTTSTMLAKYRRAAASFGEGSEATLAPLHLAVPELRNEADRGPPEPSAEPSADDEPDDTSDTEGHETAAFAMVAGDTVSLGSGAARLSGSSPDRRTRACFLERNRSATRRERRTSSPRF
ncbi:MAG: hypothetical protein ACHREM_13810 [Polyangiales bacterium]